MAAGQENMSAEVPDSWAAAPGPDAMLDFSPCQDDLFQQLTIWIKTTIGGVIRSTIVSYNNTEEQCTFSAPPGQPTVATGQESMIAEVFDSWAAAWAQMPCSTVHPAEMTFYFIFMIFFVVYTIVLFFYSHCCFDPYC